MATLRLTHQLEGTGHVVELALEGAGTRQTAVSRFGFGLTAQDQEQVRWYLEDYLQYPVDPAPQIARRVEDRLAALGCELFRRVFEANRDATGLWDAVAGSLPEIRVEIVTDLEGATAIPWELLRDPATEQVLALCAGAFVRTGATAARPVVLLAQAETLRVLLVICRPGGPADVPFRSVASHLVRLSREAREAFHLDVLRPPTFDELTRVLKAAKVAGSPYHVVHFDGHGVYLDESALSDNFDSAIYSLVSPPRPGPHGFLVFENSWPPTNQQLVDGPTLGRLLTNAGVPILVLNACRSAHADLAPEPVSDGAELNIYRRVQAYGSLAQEVADIGVGGVVAMRYNVYVVTATRFIGEVYSELLKGCHLGAAVSAARRQLAAQPRQPWPLQDWMVPVVYESAPLALWPVSEDPAPAIDLDPTKAGRERVALDPALPSGPEPGFFGRDETLLALDRAFDTVPVVLLHAWAGAGKTSTALEFARWYAFTGGTSEVIFTSFASYVTLPRLLDRIGDRFRSALAGAGVHWDSLDPIERRDWALQVLAQLPVLWVWDNVEPVTGFPAGAPSAWTAAEQEELGGFLRDLARHTRTKVLLTSRRNERAWLGYLPRSVVLRAMPMLERLQLAQAVAALQQGGREQFLQVEDWRPLLSFTRGNPLTVTVLVRQALRQHLSTREEIEAFVAELRGGAIHATDDAAQASLDASLDHGFAWAFTEEQRAQLALLALFQGFVLVNVLRVMGEQATVGLPVPVVAGLTDEDCATLLDRAAEVGLLTAYGGGYYAVHPAVLSHLQTLFERHYGSPDTASAMQAIRAWTIAMRELGNSYYFLYAQGHLELMGALGADESNLLHARHLALEHGWQDLVLGPMQGLRALYRHTGRLIEWRQLVEEVAPFLADPATDGPFSGLEEEWALLTEYRVQIAMETGNWSAAGQLQQAVVAWRRKRAPAGFTASAETYEAAWQGRLSNGEVAEAVRRQRDLAVALEQLGEILNGRQDLGCVQTYLEAAELFHQIGASREEATVAVALGNTYKNLQGVRDLDRAEHWYKRASDLLGEYDALGRSLAVAQLGSIAYNRFLEARDTGGTPERVVELLKEALSANLRALKLLPADAVGEQADIHQKLGDIYRAAGLPGRAFGHYQNAIRYQELQDDSYGAGWARVSAGMALARSGRGSDALLYFQAALRDFESVGRGTARAEWTRRLITALEKDLADEQGTDPSQYT